MGGNLRILGIDSSSPDCSVALLDNQKILAQRRGSRRSSLSDQLLPMVDEVLSCLEAGLDGVDGFAVATGPGSFTGLRVGVSLIKGFILATEKPFAGIDTLEAIAALVPPTDFSICPILDARKSEVYSAFFIYKDGRLARQSEDAANAPEVLCKGISRPTVFIGSGLNTYREKLSGVLGDLFMESEAADGDSVAVGVARLAARRLDETKSRDLSSLKINYARKSEAELNFSGGR